MHPMLDPRSTRRTVLQVGATVAGATAFSSFFRVRDAQAGDFAQNDPDPVGGGNVRYRMGVCQNCHSRCGLLGTVVDGVLVKLDGNPYHPNNMEEDERLSYATPATTAWGTRGRLCPKGQSGVQVVYDPLRVKHPLKRVGPRGSGQWQAIPWSQAFSEIAGQVNSLIPVATRLTQRIDPTVPELGFVANQLMFSPGRSTDGEIIQRIFRNTWGTSNWRLDHTSICEVSHHIHNELMTWEGGQKTHFKPDLANAEFVILFGANYLEANFPMLAASRKLVDLKKRGGKIAVVDPRFSNSAAKANWWVPAKPGTDGAVAMGIAWSILNALPATTSAYLRNSNLVAATLAGEKTWVDATRLVVTAVSGAVPSTALVGEYLEMKDWTAAGTNVNWIALVGGTPTEIKPGSADPAVVGDLLGSYTFDSGNTAGFLPAGATITAKTVYQLLRERVYDGKSVAHYAAIAGIDASLLQTLATEFVAHGKKSVANHYRGTVQHTNGFYSAGAVQLLNMLAGNFDWKGGYSVGAGSYSFNSGMTGSSYAPPGPTIDRTKMEGSFVQTAAFYDGLVAAYPTKYGFPAKRPWFPFGLHGNYQEVIPGIRMGYPYPCKVLITYWNAWPYSTPALKAVFEQTIADTSKVPLFVAIDNQIGETSAWADYILPDTTYMEKWSFPGMTPTIVTRSTAVRQPLVGSYDTRSWDAPFDPNATNDYRPIYPDTKLFEDILIGLMGALGLPNDIGGTPLPANAWAHTKKGLTNLAATAGFPGLTVGELLDKGGLFENPGSAYTGNYLKYQYAKPLRIWHDMLARYVDPMGDGTQRQDGLMPQHKPIADVRGNAVSDPDYPLQLITYKKVAHAQARTAALPWLLGIEHTNFVEMNRSDATARGLADGDEVRLSSASVPSGIVGRVQTTEGLRPGVVAVAHSFGHWQMGAAARTVDGVTTPGDPARSAGIQANVIMRLDPYLGDVGLQDKVGCSASFNDTRVNVQKVI